MLCLSWTSEHAKEPLIELLTTTAAIVFTNSLTPFSRNSCSFKIASVWEFWLRKGLTSRCSFLDQVVHCWRRVIFKDSERLAEPLLGILVPEHKFILHSSPMDLFLQTLARISLRRKQFTYIIWCRPNRGWPTQAHKRLKNRPWILYVFVMKDLTVFGEMTWQKGAIIDIW